MGKQGPIGEAKAQAPMSNAMSSAPNGRLSKARIRQIDDADVPEAVELIQRGFASPYPRGFWLDLFARLQRRTVPDGFPRYGYALESNGKLVGLILLIYSIVWKDGSPVIRCNGSTVCTDPEFSFYGPLLYARAHNDKNVTVLSITPAEHTYRMIETMGFVRYSNGLFLTMPLLAAAASDGAARVVDARITPQAPFDPRERDLLIEHAEYGCLSLWCVTPARAHPFVFRRRALKNLLPCAQLVYCSDADSFKRFARPLGAYLAKRLIPLVLLDANVPVDGLVGKYLAGRSPRYFRGPNPPILGDLAYTETAMFGI